MNENNSLKEQITKHIPNVFLSSNLIKLGERKSGKIRDLYEYNDQIIIVTTDRISAFDVILNQGIPYKGQALNQTSEFWFNKTKAIIKNHIIAVPDPNVMVAHKCFPLELEVIIRGYITGSAWRTYSKLKSEGKPLVISGVEFPNHLRKDEKLPKPVFTPTTKAQTGHDEDISIHDILSRKIVSKAMLDQIIEISYKLYEEGSRVVNKQGGILADTKFEFGLNSDDELVLIDEVLTADSSRYWFSEFYEDRFERGEDQQGLDKEYIRSWLRENGFSGNGPVPNLPVEAITKASLNVIFAYEMITGQKFIPAKEYASNERILTNLLNFFMK